MDEQGQVEGTWEAARASVSGPTYGARPGETKFAPSRSGLAALPSRPPPSPHFSGPREPSLGKPIGRIAPPWYQAKWLRVTTALVVVLVVAVVAINAISGGGNDDGVDATPGAPAPAGYRMIKTDSYQFAVPRAWNTKALDAKVMTASAATAGRGDHQLTVATDPATRDTINVVPYEAAGDSLQKRVLAEFEADFRNGVAGTRIVSLRVDPATVHGFPAGRLSASIIGRHGRPATVVSAVVETPDGLFQITVTSANGQRAATLERRVLPTFDIR